MRDGRVAFVVLVVLAIIACDPAGGASCDDNDTLAKQLVRE